MRLDDARALAGGTDLISLMKEHLHTPKRVVNIKNIKELGGISKSADGIRIAVFYTKIYNRLLVPLTAANQPQAPPGLRAALTTITRHVDDYITRARLPHAA